MKVKELKAALEDLGLSTKGKKAELEARLAEAEIVEEEEDVIEEVIDDNDSEEEEAPEEVLEEEEPVEEPVAEEEEEAAPDMDGGENCECEWCANGYAHR